MDLNDFRRLFVYDAWANHEVLAALRAAKSAPPRSVRYMAHIVAAEKLWLERLEQRAQTLPVWSDFTIEQCESQASEMTSLWENFLEGRAAADLLSRISIATVKERTGAAVWMTSYCMWSCTRPTIAA